MKWIIVEYFILTFFFYTLFYFGTKQKNTRGMTTVKNLRYKCQTELDMRIYDGLIRNGLYVSPAIKCGSCKIPLALEPYKVALFTYSKNKQFSMKRLKLKHKLFYVKSLGWKVIKIPYEDIQNDYDRVMNDILNEVKIRKVR